MPELRRGRKKRRRAACARLRFHYSRSTSVSFSSSLSIRMVVCCMPMIFQFPFYLTSVRLYLPPVHFGTSGSTSLARLAMTLPVIFGTRSTTVQVA